MSNRVRVLALDDDPNRHMWLQGFYPRHEVVAAHTYNAAIHKLESESWDILHLDHDLADGINHGIYPDVDAFGRPYDGRDLVAWLIAHPDRCPRYLYIHSWSDCAADMEMSLRVAYKTGRLAHVRGLIRKMAPV